MTELYRIRPQDKKSVEAFYDVYSKDANDNIRSWSVTEIYRWGQGFIPIDEGPIYADDKSIVVDPNLGWGCELDDLCYVNFEFDESFTDEEKAEIEQAWEDGGAAWLFDGDHEWQVDYDSITILGPYIVDIIDEDQYNVVIKENIELENRPPFKPTKAWPFGD